MSETIPTQTGVSTPTSAPKAGAPTLPAGSVGTEQLANEAVTTAKIALSAITSALIANETIVAEDIAAGAITEPKLAALAVTAAKLAAGAVTAAKLGPEAVEAAAIKALAITEGKIAAEAVSEGKLVKALTEKINPSAWTALETLEKVEDGKAALETSAIGVRTEDGVMARLRGGLKCTAAIPTTSKIFTLPVKFRPVATVYVLSHAGAQSCILQIQKTGEVRIEVSAELAIGNLILLDGLTWSIT